MTNEIEKVEKRSPRIYEITGRRAEPKRHMHDYRNRKRRKKITYNLRNHRTLSGAETTYAESKILVIDVSALMGNK